MYTTIRDLAQHIKDSLGLEHSLRDIENAIGDHHNLFTSYERITTRQLDRLERAVWRDLTRAVWPFGTRR